MIYSAIDHGGPYFYTDMKRVFDTIGDRQKNYNWLITGCECYPANPETEAMLRKPYCWIDGETLTDLVNRERFQWVWAVLSGFEKTAELSDVLKSSLPYADGYEGFWKTPFTLQHPLAELEIVPWDSSATLIFSKDKAIIDDFRRHLPGSEDMEDYLAKL